MKHSLSASVGTILLYALAGSSANAAVCQPFVNDVDGCSSVGDVVQIVVRVDSYGTARLTPACNGHDICWQTLGFSKDECDNLFLSDMRSACLRAYPGSGTAIANAALNCASGSSKLQLQSRGWNPGRGIRRGFGKVYREVFRIDDNLKNGRDKLVDNVVNTVDIAYRALDSVPGISIITDIVGNPADLLRCASDVLQAGVNNIIPQNTNEIGNLFLSGLRDARGGYQCLTYSELMFQAVRLSNNPIGNPDPPEIFSNRQRDSYRVAFRNSVKRKTAEGGCDINADEMNLFRSIESVHDIRQTVVRLYEQSGNPQPDGTIFQHIVCYAAAVPSNWQLDLIYELESDNPDPVNNLTQQGTVILSDLDSSEVAEMQNLLKGYHGMEIGSLRRMSNRTAARFHAAF
jgi:hypothetical protein